MKKEGCNIDINPLNKPFGGIRPGGGYDCDTEYEIGAQRIAEALHCILGSLHKIHTGGNTDWKKDEDQKEHILEELRAIKVIRHEYSNKRYVDDWYNGTQESLISIRESSQKLQEKTDCLMKQLFFNKKKIDPGIFDTSMKCYQFLKNLARDMGKSAEGQKTRPRWNALMEGHSQYDTNKLSRSVNELYKIK